MRRIVAVLCLALMGGGCVQPDKQFVGAMDAAFRDYRASADPAIDKDPTLSESRKKALKAESAEIQKTIDSANGD